jgi:hypothetical protein
MFKRRNLFKSLLGFLVIPEELPTPNVPRTLKANWTFEAEQDLLALHNEFADSEIVALMAAEIQKEIDSEIINKLIEESKKMPI